MLNKTPDTLTPGAAGDAPRTETERQLADIWRAVLKLDRVGIYDDFLALGGHSLSATLVINCICDRFAVQVPLDLFFDEPAHIAELAARIDAMRDIRT